MKRIVLLFTVLGLSVSAFSQVTATSDKLSGEDFENVAAEIRKKVKNFQRSVGHLAGNEYSHGEKLKIRERQLEHFMGKGERYLIANPTYDGYDTVWHNAVVMGSAPSKKDRGSRKYEPMKDYLSRLIRNSENRNYRYKKVVIEGADIVTVDNFRKVGDGRYMAAAHFLQKFQGYYSADMVSAAYQDYSAKTITIFINLIETEQHDGSSEHYWEIKLGDVDCDDVW